MSRYARAPIDPWYAAGGHARHGFETSPAQRGAQEPCPPPCPSCGGLECLCRPRFFAGQLLTEQDLNRLEDYVVAKNRLHNRYVHGWGVVCGLEVVCHPCRDAVTVRPGYALSPCGDDIIVCRDAQVDICEIINRCRPPRDECEWPGGNGGRETCPDREEEWVLAICYKETPSHGITPLRGGGCSCESSRCKCGGTGGGDCGCGCGGGTKKANGGAANGHSRPPAGRNRPPACEPTLTCETYTFTAYKPPPRDPVDDDGARGWPDMGEMINRMMRCLLDLFERLPARPQNATPQQLHAWCHDLKHAIRDFLRQHPSYDCLLDEALANIRCPDPASFANDPNGYNNALDAVVADVGQILASFIRYCLCSNLLPPCPCRVDANCVPLATVTVSYRQGACRVVRVCNWGPRTFAVTFPQLRYWFSPLQLAKNLAEAMENLCCTALQFSQVREINRSAVNPAGSAPAGPAAAPAPEMPAGSKVKPWITLLLQALADPSRRVDAATLARGALGARDERNEPLVSPLELRYPAHFLLANQLLGPAAASILGRDVGNMLHGVAGGLGRMPAPGSAPASELQELRAMMADLQRKVSEQAEEIRDLRNR